MTTARSRLKWLSTDHKRKTGKMSTNATTWFYKEPETGRPYLITERVTHTFWANRLSGIYLTCIHAEPPYRVEGEWQGMHVEMEWEVGKRFILRTDREDTRLIAVCREVLGFKPTVGFIDSENRSVTEWYTNTDDGRERLKALQGNPAYHNIHKGF
jgi:hypothetical protein